MDIIFLAAYHLTQETLEEYARNRAVGRHLQAIEEHLIECAACREQVEIFDEEIRILRQTLRFAELEQ
jgi:predicted anti-sigma-YlaC factor YlaD